MSKTRIYAGNFPSDIREREIEDLFEKYGRIRDLNLRGGRGGAPFAFIEYDDARDADDAVRGRDGYNFGGRRLRVEYPKGGGDFNDRGGGGGAGGGRRGEFSVIVENIPAGGSWQDLKDFCREGGITQVVRTDVQGSEGTVEFSSAGDVERAIKSLDDTKFRSHMGETGYVRLRDAKGGSGGGGGGGGAKSSVLAPRAMIATIMAGASVFSGKSSPAGSSWPIGPPSATRSTLTAPSSA